MTGTAFVLLCVGLGDIPVGLALDSSPRQDDGAIGGNLRSISSSIGQRPEVNQSFIFCNAYAYSAPLNVVRVRSQRQANEQGPIQYKSCQSAVLPLENGDQLEFKAGGMHVGTFRTQGLPKHPSTLLVIPHRRDPSSMAVSFTSHSFSDMDSGQVAVVDAYQGKDGTVVNIRDFKDATQKEGLRLPMREEELAFNSIRALRPGKYEVALTQKGNPKANGTSFQQLAVAGKEKYVIMRVGNDGDEHGPTEATRASFAQELVVFRAAAPASAGLRFGVIVGLLVACWAGA